MFFRGALVAALVVNSVRAESWPYTRTYDNRTTPSDEDNATIPNLFVAWLKGSLAREPAGGVASAFSKGRIPDHVTDFESLERHTADHKLKPNQLPKVIWDAIPDAAKLPPAEEAAALFSHLNVELEPECITSKEMYYYRQPDGRCNWLKKGQSDIGSTGQPRSRDFHQTTYADGISKPREGPNPREVSNAFFKRKQRLSYEHTPLMLGLVEFLMHDVTYSEDSTDEFIDVPIPKGDPDYDYEKHGNASFRVWRSKPFPGSGTSKSNPRQQVNGATAWLDVSALYGSTPEVVDALRSHQNGKLKAQRGKDGFEYLPFNTEGLPVRTRPGVDPHTLFLGGDVRTNEDWILLSVHTLLFREHNRLCDIVVGQHPDWDDERIYQTVKLLLGAKVALIGNSYQMAYWSKSMPWPRDDGFPLYRAIYGESVLKISPLHLYPWPMVTRDDRPMVTSAEMSIVYRFHEFIINNFPIKDEHNKTVKQMELFNTAFDAKGYLDLGADSILRGMLATDIPNFKSGVDESFRSAGKYRGNKFDIVTWSLVHEREQGLPTFNQYFQGYASMTPKPELLVKYRKRFEDFSSDPEVVKNLKRLYKTPDDVDFVVGVQLEEELFPGTTMPISALIPSLFSLFGVGNSDRFSPGFAVMRCLLVDKPWNCHPSNALEEMIWEPRPTEEFPNKRWFSDFWMKELDFQAHGVNLLWRLITENSGAHCIQKNPLFPFDKDTNPVLCELPPPPKGIPWKVIGGVALGLILPVLIRHLMTRRQGKQATPPVNWGSFIIGVGQDLQKDPKGFLTSQYSWRQGKTFGLRLFGKLVYYVAAETADLEVMMNDEPRASLHAITADTQLGAIVGRHNFKHDLHAAVIRRRLETAASETVPALAPAVAGAVEKWLRANPLRDTDDIAPQITRLMACVMSRLCMGSASDTYDAPELIDAYLKLNADSDVVFGVSNLLPGPIARLFADAKVHSHYKTILRFVLPAVRRRRAAGRLAVNRTADDLLGFFVEATDNDQDAGELVAGIVIGGLINVAVALTNAIYNIAEVDGLADKLRTHAPPNAFVATRVGAGPWDALRGVTLETLRLSACIFGPVRKIIVDGFKLGSNPALHVPKDSGLAASPYLVHYSNDVYDNASTFEATRFTGTHDAPMGTPKYLTFGLPGHTCPGRFLAIEAVSIALNTLLSQYHFQLPVPPVDGEERYKYSVGTVVMPRIPKKLIITRRA